MWWCVKIGEDGDNVNDREYIWSRVVPEPNTGCWLWQLSLDRHGYGKARSGKRSVWGHAHRLAYRAFNGDIDPGLLVCHTCDTPSCCNPDHLFVGTPRDNVRDMMAKGRRPHTKLSAAQVEVIRQSNDTHRALSDRFKCSQSLISMIRSGDRW